MKMEQTECLKTFEYKIQMLGNYPEESIKYNFFWSLNESETWSSAPKNIKCV